MRLFQRVMQNNLVPLYDFCGTGGYRHERHTPNVVFFLLPEYTTYVRWNVVVGLISGELTKVAGRPERERDGPVRVPDRVSPGFGELVPTRSSPTVSGSIASLARAASGKP